MEIVKLFKELKKLNKKEDDFSLILSQIILGAAESQFEHKSCEIQVSRELWGYDWTYYKDTQGKKMLGYNYHELRSETFQKKGEEGVKALDEKYILIYDPKVYEDHLSRLKEVIKKLNKLGFKSKISYSKNYKKCSVNNEPDSIWLLVSW